MTVPALRTERLLLRGWRDEDLEPYAALNRDPEVMEHFPAPLTPEASASHVEHIAAHFTQHAFGLWAVEVVAGPDPSPFIGFVGLSVPGFEAHFTPCVEIGWRLARHAWGNGYATEAAREAMRYGFEEAGLDEIVSFTTTANEASRRVMRRLGMRHDPADDFDHPSLPPGHRLRRHVLHRITADEWQRQRASRS